MSRALIRPPRRGAVAASPKPGDGLSANEIAAAEAVRVPGFNAQTQTRTVWPATAAVARATLDGLVRDAAITPARAAAVTAGLDAPARLAAVAQAVDADATAASGRTAERLRGLAETLRGIGDAR